MARLIAMKGYVSNIDCIDSEDMRHSSCVQTICLSGKKFYAEVSVDRVKDTVSLSIEKMNNLKEECEYSTSDVLEDLVETIKRFLLDLVK